MTEREIGGTFYRCAKLPAEPGLALFLRVSAELSAARGLFEAIALGDEAATETLIAEFFAFTSVMNADRVHALIVELAALPRKADGEKPEPVDMRELLELAFFAIGVQFAGFLPVGLGAMFPENPPEGEAPEPA